MSFIKKIKTFIKNKKINSEIKRYKYVHIMFNDKFNKPYVDFLNENFDSSEHLVLCKRLFKEFPFPEGKNVFEITTLKGLNFESAQKVFLHSLFDGEVVDYMFEHQDILKEKAYWIIWGGDLYGAARDEKNDFVRKNVKGYIALVKDDAFVAKERYGSNPELYNTPYRDPMAPYIMKSAENIVKPDYIKIQINNSADKSTLDMLEILSKFKDENIRITTPLSYGDMKYKDEIIQKGREIFGDKFEYLDKIMKPEEYVEHLSKNHILILYQNRQQGGGNAFVSLILGTKVYCRKEIATYKYMEYRGGVPFDANLIKDIDFEEFVNYNELDKTKSMENAADFYSGKVALKEWTYIFEGHQNI